MRTEFRFEGLSLTVRDLEESLRLYRDKLNLKVVYSATPAFAMLRAGVNTVGLLSLEEAKRAGVASATSEQRRGVHLEFMTDDLDGLYDELRENDVVFHEPPHREPWEYSIGSQQTASIGAAVIAAQRALITTLLAGVRKNSPLASLTFGDVFARDGGLCKIDDPKRHESYASILAHAQREEVTVEAAAADAVETEQWSMHSFGAMFCEVRVSAVTAETRVNRFLGSFDSGVSSTPRRVQASSAVGSSWGSDSHCWKRRNSTSETGAS